MTSLVMTDVNGLVERGRQAATVLDEEFHRETVAACILEMADRIEELEAALRDALELVKPRMVEAVKKSGRRGRPPLHAGQSKRASFNTRLTPALKDWLEKRAAENGRSLSEEIEYRLHQSRTRDEEADDLRDYTQLRLEIRRALG